MAKELNLKKSFEWQERAETIIAGETQTISKRARQFAYGAYPMFIEKGSGCHVWDVDGNKYIDFVNALGPITLGYCYREVDDAVKKQLGKGMIFGQPHPLEVEAAEAICETVPSLDMVRFVKTGAEATSAAVRLARAYTGREYVLTQGYHGWHDQWSVLRNDGGIPRELIKYTVPFAYNDLDALHNQLRRFPGQVAAVILEPCGVEMPSEHYLKELAFIARDHGAVVIFDEIVTGFRLAPGGAQEYFEVDADLVCYAKGIANGMPLAAVAGKGNIMKRMRDLIISSTYGGEALSLAAVVAALKVYKDKPVHKHLWEMGQRLMDGMNDCFRKHELRAECIGAAPMSGIRLHYGRPELESEIWAFILGESAKRGVLFRRTGLNFITYSHSKKDIEKVLSVYDEVCETLAEHIREDTLSSVVKSESERSIRPL